MLLLLPAMLFAGFSYRFDLLSFDPLHQEYTADRDRAGLDFQWTYVWGWPDGVYQSSWDGSGLTFYPFQSAPGVKPGGSTVSDGYDEFPWMGLIHLGETLGLARNTFSFDHWLSPISIGFAFQGSLLLGFEGGMADMVGYDGVFFYGAEMSVADKVSMRFGLHHYCTHYGDGTLKLLGLDMNDKVNPGFQMYKKYIRMEAFVFGLSIHPWDFIRTYVEYNWISPLVTEHFDTGFFAPTWRGSKVKDMPDSYNAGIVNFGIELSWPIFPKLGKTTLSYDCHAYEEGKIVYKKEDLKKEVIGGKPLHLEPYYDANRPWEFEHELVLSQQINEIVSFEIGYHHGRFPLNSLYHVQSDYVYVGARVNPDATVTLFDTAEKN